MRAFSQTKYFLYKINDSIPRFDTEFLDPRHQKLMEYLQSTKITKGYELKRIGELCHVFAGKTAKKYVDYGVPIIKLRNVTGKGIDWGIDYVEEDFFSENVALHIHRNDILLTSTGDGTIGRADLYDRDAEGITDGHVTVLTVKSNEELLPRYLLYYLRSKLGQIQIERRIVGSTGQTELNDPDIETILLLYPKEISEQESIVNTVFEIETDAVEKENRVDKELRKIENIISEELALQIKHEPKKFYTIHLSKSSERMDFDFNNPFYDEYELLIEKSKYPFVELKELVTFSSETKNPLKMPDEQFFYVDIGNIDTRWGTMTPEPLKGYEATSDRMRKLMRCGQVLISTTRPTRRAIAIVPEKLDDQVCSTGFAVLQCKDCIYNEYLFHILRSSIIMRQFEKFSSGSSYPEISKEKDLPRIKVPCPDSIDEQKRIVSRIKSIINHALKLYDESVAKRQKEIEIFESFF